MGKNIAVIGSGSWGLALSNHMAELGNNVKVWSFTKEESDLINNEHKSSYLKDIKIQENVICSNDYKEVVENADFIFHVTPSKFSRNTFNEYKKYVGSKPVIICSKGFEDSSLSTLDKVFKDELPEVRVATLSGPSFAAEVANHMPTAILLSSEDNELLDEVSKLLSNETMRIYKSNDVIGVEVGGALKNVIAFCMGVAVGLEFGTNSQSALVTRGLAEISRLGVKMGAKSETFFGLSGLGDLILTCSSDESRNRRAGKLIAKGLSIEETRKEINATIESIDNIETAKKLAEKYEVDMPIVNAANEVLFNGLDPKEATKRLMTRELKFETE
ncbi:MAG: NAD(P)-dependent glycerol-3-phosphate dehydrogenase [Clostridia bacterium]|nr:NAD(P)-dependent glycerol-3-phosphate dehydrogenase [Clostridia bacterium]